ncbi:MAG: cation diffusion facilitator family transporter, partial [Nitrospirota bacterium]
MSLNVEKPFFEQKERQEDGRKVAAYSTVLNSFLTLTKGGLAIFSGSAAVLAETIHSLTDVIGSLAVWTGIIISRKKSPAFPWGLYKVENIAAIISAFLILLMAYEVGKNTLLSGTKEITNINISLVALFLMIIPIFLFVRYEKKKAVELNSPSLLADTKHWITHIGSMGVVIGGLACSVIYPHADKIASVIIIAFIIKAGYDVAKDSMKSLLDASVDIRTLDKIKKIVSIFKEVEEITALNARNSGSFIFVHLNVRFSVKRLREAHQIAETIEKAIRKEIPFVERVVIHYEPEKKDYVRYAVPLLDRQGDISEHFGSAPFIALWDKSISNGKVISQEILENPFLEMEKGKGIKLAEFLVEHGVDILYTKKHFEHKGPEYVF